MKQLERKAATKEGLTLADLGQFLQEAESMGIDPREQVLVYVGFKAQIKKMVVRGARD